MLQRPSIGEAVLDLLRSTERRDEARWFVLDLPFDHPPLDRLYLRFDPNNELHRLQSMRLEGELEQSRQRLDLDLRDFSGTVFGHSEVVLGGRRHLVVATVDGVNAVKSVSVLPDKEHENGSEAKT